VNCVYLTAGPDGVAYTAPGWPARPAGDPLAAFAEDAVVRLAGRRDNLRLAVRLWASGRAVEVCAPTRPAGGPSEALLEASQVALAASAGGFCRVDGREVAAYLVAMDGRAAAPEAVAGHPALFALDFLGVPRPLALDLLACLVDPRWFSDPTAPDRPDRLYRYLGVGCGPGRPGPDDPRGPRAACLAACLAAASGLKAPATPEALLSYLTQFWRARLARVVPTDGLFDPRDHLADGPTVERFRRGL
jgi:hypothetical protein